MDKNINLNKNTNKDNTNNAPGNNCSKVSGIGKESEATSKNAIRFVDENGVAKCLSCDSSDVTAVECNHCGSKFIATITFVDPVKHNVG